MEVRGRYPARSRGVISRAQCATDDRDGIIPDVDDGPVEERALDPAEQPAHLDGQVRLLEHLPGERLGVRLTWLDTATWDGPQPSARLAPALDHQQAALPVGRDGGPA